jgi:CheY-like chemotaxis protein
MNKNPFDLYKTIKNIKDLLNKKCLAKNIKLNLNFDLNIPKYIIGDKVKIRQIIMNLVGNAIKFTEKGVIDIDISISDQNERTIILDFSVVDIGIGISIENIERIFNRFEQGGIEITRKYGGTGLGLSISKNLVELHNSKLNVKSKLGEGSAFSFKIEYDKVSKNFIPIEKKSISNFENLKNVRILICEDNILNIKLIRNLLRKSETNLTIAENGRKAIAILLNDSNFDLILMDIGMPEINGIEATKIIRGKMGLKIPIIGFTANSSNIERELCLSIGMNDYIKKTFISEEFLDKISTAISIQAKKNLLSNSNYIYKNSNPTRRSNSNSNSTKFAKNNNNYIFNQTFPKRYRSEKNLLRESEIFKILEFTKQSEMENKIEKKDLIDIKVIKEYSEGDLEFEKELVQLFLIEFPKDVESLELTILNEDNIGANFFIHKMRAPLMILGLNSTLKKLIKIEKLIDQPNKIILKKEYGLFKIEFKTICELLNDYILYIS